MNRSYNQSMIFNTVLGGIWNIYNKYVVNKHPFFHTKHDVYTNDNYNYNLVIIPNSNNNILLMKFIAEIREHNGEKKELSDKQV